MNPPLLLREFSFLGWLEGKYFFNKNTTSMSRKKINDVKTNGYNFGKVI